MKDSEKLILHSFLFALSQQKESLPNDVVEKIQEVARSLETQVIDLYDIAIATPQLTQDYKNAYKLLTSDAAERGMGLEFLPAKSDERGTDKEQPNIATPVEVHVEEMQKVLETIDKKLDQAPAVLADENPTNAARQKFH